MPRPPKKVDGVAVPVPLVPAISAAIDANAFKQVRDSISQQLDFISNMIQTVNTDFKRQTNLLLGVSDDVAIPAGVTNLAQFMVPPPAADVPPVEEKKERKKRTHDPNAPKRPLTPYFLYMQTARPIIANDLGADAAKGAVQEEGQRRWGSMSANDKSGWNNAYQYNLRLYNARVHSYKNGNLEAKNMTDEEALRYADSNAIPMPQSEDAGGNDNDAIAQQLQGGDEPAKTPKKGAAGRKRKTATPGADPELSKAAPPSSPDKKRRRSTKAPEEKEEPKKPARGKKAKA